MMKGPTAAEDGDGPAPEEQSSHAEDMYALDEGYYGLEAIRRKRIRKGEAQYLIKWCGYPEAENTWEPLENLQYCLDDIEAFEESLKAGKQSSCKRRRKGAASQPKKRQQIRSLATPSAEALIREKSLTSLPVEAVSAATNGDTVRSQVPEQGGPANDTMLSGRCIGAKRRKSGNVQRFVPQAGTSIIDGTQDVSDPNASSGIATNQGIQKVSSGTLKTMYESTCITKIFNPTSCTVSSYNNAKEVVVIFTAKRADGTEVMVDNKFLKANHPDLLMNFYEQHLWHTQT